MIFCIKTRLFKVLIVGSVNKTILHFVQHFPFLVSSNRQTLRIKKIERPQHALRFYAFYRTSYNMISHRRSVKINFLKSHHVIYQQNGNFMQIIIYYISWNIFKILLSWSSSLACVNLSLQCIIWMTDKYVWRNNLTLIGIPHSNSA